MSPGKHSFGPEELLFLPLGRSRRGEIGMNPTLYGHAATWIAVDLGITFGGDDSSSVPSRSSSLPRTDTTIFRWIRVIR